MIKNLKLKIYIISSIALLIIVLLYIISILMIDFDGDSFNSTVGNCDDICSVYYIAQKKIMENENINDLIFPKKSERRSHVIPNNSEYKINSWYSIIDKNRDTVKFSFKCVIIYNYDLLSYEVKELVTELINNELDDNIKKNDFVLKLSNLKSGNLDCSVKEYWELISKGKKSIPLLIENISDTTMSDVYNDCKKERLNVGELSFFALNEIVELPIYKITKIQFCVFDDQNCWSFYDYLFDNSKKIKLQTDLRNYFLKSKLIFKEYHKSEINDCMKKYSVNGKYYFDE